MAGPEVNETATTRSDEVPMPYVGTQAYATRKTVAQGMMDFALLIGNAAQMKILTDDADNLKKPQFIILLLVIVLSVILQIIVGIIILILGSMHAKSQRDHDKAQKMNNATVGLIFVITVINMFIGVFIMTLEMKSDKKS